MFDVQSQVYNHEKVQNLESNRPIQHKLKKVKISHTINATETLCQATDVKSKGLAGFCEEEMSDMIFVYTSENETS